LGSVRVSEPEKKEWPVMPVGLGMGLSRMVIAGLAREKVRAPPLAPMV